MEFPVQLRAAIEEKIVGCKREPLLKTARSISDRYRTESGAGKKLVTTDAEATVYALTRMPATFGAVSAALRYALESAGLEIESLLDAGAGTGAAAWAADGLLPLKKVVCFERERAMRRLGQALMREGSEVLKNAEWAEGDLIRDALPIEADLVVSSYVLNEMAERDREETLRKLFSSAKKMLLVVEPGTPASFALLKKARAFLLKEGARIAAPCPHEGACRLSEEDWCHFTTRIQRSKTHRALKEGDAPFEDEKFAYMAFTREPVKRLPARILRHPSIEKGQVSLQLCTRTENTSIVVRKRDGERFKRARKAKCGDPFDID